MTKKVLCLFGWDLSSSKVNVHIDSTMLPFVRSEPLALLNLAMPLRAWCHHRGVVSTSRYPAKQMYGTHRRHGSVEGQ
jgi:hypothetical protein